MYAKFMFHTPHFWTFRIPLSENASLQQRQYIQMQYEFYFFCQLSCYFIQYLVWSLFNEINWMVRIRWISEVKISIFELDIRTSDFFSYGNSTQNTNIASSCYHVKQRRGERCQDYLFFSTHNVILIIWTQTKINECRTIHFRIF